MVYASTDDLQNGWRDLSPSELLLADELLDRASVLMDEAMIRHGLAPSSEIKKIVCCDVVRLSFHYGSQGTYYGDGVSAQPMVEGLNGGPLKLSDNQLSMLGYKKTKAGLFSVGTYDEL